MSVFTPLARPELETFLAPYGLGRLLDFQGIAAGSENTNFFISMEKGEFVLTLVERGPVQEMPFFIDLLDVLHEADLPVPYALRTTDGVALRELKGKPALLQPRLAGKHIKQAAEPVRGEKGFQLRPSQRGEHRHVLTASTGAGIGPAPIEIKKLLPLKDLPRRNQHIRLIRTNEVCIGTVRTHQKVRLAAFRCDFDRIQEAVLTVLLNGFIAFRADRYFRVRRGLVIRRHDSQRSDCKEASQQQAI